MTHRHSKKESHMPKIVIIGAGLTGLSTAYHLEQAGYYDYTLYEKEDSVGGLCRSIYQDGFTFDYTGHLLHSNDAYFTNLLNSIVGMNHFNIVSRKAFIYSQNTYTHYPYQSNLYGLPIDFITQAIEDFIQRPQQKKQSTSFYQWALSMFGKTITHHFFVPYQEKIFAYPITKLSASWTGRFVPHITLHDIIQGALQPPRMQEAGYNANFLYPKSGGIFSWVKEFAHRIHKKPLLNHCVQDIDIEKKIITFTNGNFDTFDLLITTMPLDTLLHLAKEPAASCVTKAKTKLLCNSVINFNLGIAHPHISDKHWIYLPEKQFPHYRIGFYHNFSSHMAPQGCSSLYGELSYMRQEHNLSEKITTALSMTQQLLTIDESMIITKKIIPISHAYVIYNRWRDNHLPDLLNHLKSYNIHSIGRYGAWKYASMQEAILDGKQMAETIIQPTPTTYVNNLYSLKKEHA